MIIDSSAILAVIGKEPGYERIVHDPTFWQAWRNTLEFTVLALIVGYAVPFFVALLLNELRNARGYLRFLVYLPVMLPPV